MTRTPIYGLLLATIGALILTPDTMFMRLSDMSGFQMLAWRGLCAGAVMMAMWFLQGAPGRKALISAAGLAIIACHFVNASLFTIGIAIAPVAIVLFGVATSPIFAAVFALFTGERVPPATWAAIAAVLAGIALAVFGRPEGSISLDRSAVLGAAAGLAVAASLAMSFMIIRHVHAVPIQPAIGGGSLIAGLTGLIVVGGPSALLNANGEVWAIAITGLVILPASFLLLTLASRHTSATNVSLLLLLETVLGPVWVWLGAGETMTAPMIIGGMIVVISLAVYLTLGIGRRRR
jgi:drug/metabolite transporter (DMT)-like permease